MTPWLHLKNFSVYVPPRKPIVKNLSLSLAHNDSLAVFGPTGSGKSVFLKGLMGLLPITGSMIVLKHADISHQPEHAHLEPVYDQIGFAFQKNGLFDFCTVEENLFLGDIMRHPEQREERSGVDAIGQELLEHLGLWEHRNKYPDQLSGGQKKRVAIARAMSKQPHVLIADDPLAGLDPVTSMTVLDMLIDVVKKYDVGLIATISSAAIVEGRFSHCLVLHQGESLFFGTSTEFHNTWPKLSQEFSA